MPVPYSPDSPRTTDGETDPASPTGAPRWVKVVGVAALLFVVLVGVMLLAGHGPGRHTASRGTGVPSAVSTLSRAGGLALPGRGRTP